MREIRPSGSEGGVALTRHPYPYHNLAERSAPSSDPGSQCACFRSRCGGPPRAIADRSRGLW
jgi:hypothetical protein